MHNVQRGLTLAIAGIALLWVAVASAQPNVGDTVRLKATHHAGVPLHNLPQNTHDYQNRRTATERIANLELDTSPVPDTDVVILGDYNTMGRKEPPLISADDELVAVDQEVGTGFTRLHAGPACTEYYKREGGLLDHFVVATGMQEVGTITKVTGYCALKECADIPAPEAMPAAYEKLSDHCPVVLAISDEDLD